MPPLFSEAQLRLFLSEHPLDADTCEKKLAILRILLRRKSDGTLAGLTEKRIEQSFNEQLFAQIFDYKTLLRDGEGEYHLLPQNYRNVGSGGTYDDFSLGFFSPLEKVALATAELKSPGTDLDAIQPSETSHPWNRHSRLRARVTG